jgi:hypothetical protein
MGLRTSVSLMEMAQKFREGGGKIYTPIPEAAKPAAE